MDKGKPAFGFGAIVRGFRVYILHIYTSRCINLLLNAVDYLFLEAGGHVLGGRGHGEDPLRSARRDTLGVVLLGHVGYVLDIAGPMQYHRMICNTRE